MECGGLERGEELKHHVTRGFGYYSAGLDMHAMVMQHVHCCCWVRKGADPWCETLGSGPIKE